MCPLIYALRFGTKILKYKLELVVVVKILINYNLSFYIVHTIVSLEIVEGIGSRGTVE